MSSSPSLPCSSSTENVNVAPRASFLGIPLDVRGIVYEILLTNPILGLSLSVSESTGFGRDAKYNLHPNILAACRQTYLEGAGILYGLNKFYIATLPDSFYSSGSFTGSENNLCPIMRYLSYREYDNNFSDVLRGAGTLGSVKALTAVRSWNVVLAVDTEDERGRVGAMAKPPVSLVRFCNAILRSCPRSMDIAIIPKGVQRGQDTSAEFIPMATMLEPLGNVHSVEKVTFRDATIFEVPDAIQQDEDALEFHSHMQEEVVLEVQLVEQMQSDVKVEFAFEMYHPLLRYAQSFERYDPFKKIMAVSDDEYNERDGIGSEDEYENSCAKGNPFYGDFVHPVEQNVMAAKVEAINNDIQAFKRSRKLVLQYLESQYHRILKAAGDLLEFVLVQKKDSYGGLFDAETRQQPVNESHVLEGDVLKAVVLLEEYAASFQREMPLEIKVQFRKQKISLNNLYAMMEPNMQLERVIRAFEARDLRHFVEWYQSAVDLFDKQFLEIRAARKELFKFDVREEFEVSLGIENLRLDEPIRWDINEPELGPWPEDEYWHYDGRDPWDEQDGSDDQDEQHDRDDSDQSDDGSDGQNSDEGDGGSDSEDSSDSSDAENGQDGGVDGADESDGNSDSNNGGGEAEDQDEKVLQNGVEPNNEDVQYDESEGHDDDTEHGDGSPSCEDGSGANESMNEVAINNDAPIDALDNFDPVASS